MVKWVVIPLVFLLQPSITTNCLELYGYETHLSPYDGNKSVLIEKTSREFFADGDVDINITVMALNDMMMESEPVSFFYTTAILGIFSYIFQLLNSLQVL